MKDVEEGGGVGESRTEWVVVVVVVREESGKRCLRGRRGRRFRVEEGQRVAQLSR